MADNSVQISIEMETLQATKDLKKFQEQSTKSISTIEDTFQSLKAAALAAVAVFAGGKVVGFFNDIISAASESDQAIQQLNVALASTGEFSNEASQGIQDYATELQKTTGITDEAILGAFSLAKTFGITNQQAQDLTSAAVDLAAATGKDLDTAVQQLGATYSGTAGKLSKLGPEFKNLTELQLKNGEAIKLVGQRFEGTAVALTDTFAGAVRQAKNAYGDLFEVLGASITQNTVVVASVKSVALALQDLGKYLQSNQKEVGNFISDSIKLFFTVLPTGVQVLGYIGSALGNTAKILVFLYNVITGVGAEFYKIFLFFKEGKKAVDDFNQALQSLEAGRIEKVVNVYDGAEKIFNVVSKTTDELSKKITSVSYSLDKSAKGIKNNETSTRDLTKANDDLKGSYDKIKGALEGIVNENNKLTKSKNELIDVEFEANLQSLKNAQLELLAQGKTRDEVEQLTSAYRDAIVVKRNLAKEKLTVGDLNIGEILAPNITAQLSDSIKKANFGDLAKNAANVFDAALSGAEGAKKFVAGLSGKLADSVVPGLGPLVESIFGKLAAGKEQAKQFVTEFVDAIPDIVTAIAEALPDALIRLFEKVLSAEFLAKLGVAMGRGFIKVVTGGTFGRDVGIKISDAFKAGISGIGASFAAQFLAGVSTFGQQILSIFSEGGALVSASIFGGFSQGIAAMNASFQQLGIIIITSLRDTGDAVARAFTGAGNNIASSFYDPVNRLIGFLNQFKFKIDLPNIGGAGGGFINSIGKTIDNYSPFAEGGMVPSGYPNDTFPARLSSGELVIPRDMVQQLGSFLNNGPQQSNNSGDLQTALLAKIANLLQQPINAQTSVNVNQKALADIILKLNRNNARLTA